MDNSTQRFKARRDTEDKIGLFGSLLGLAVSPWDTTQQLLSKERPEYVYSFLLILFLVIFGPAICYLTQYYDTMLEPSRIYNYLIAFFMFLSFYTILLSLYLFILGLEFNFTQLFAIVVYSLTPVISVFIILYSFYYLGSKNLDFLFAAAQGHFKSPQAYAKILPYIVIISQFSMYFILSFSIRALAEASMPSALIYGLLAIVPIAVAAFGTAYVANIFNPGSKELVFAIINSQISVWGF